MRIEVLGPGCMKCQTLLRNVEQVLAETGIHAEVAKVTDVFEIAARGVNRTPAIAIDGELKLQGRVATVDEIRGWLVGNSATQ
ncbi:MAG TPA: thioredoxin family protein [Firmicutes bacterium]|nr:thioredoxin family protein [Bacillota bacterium]